MRGRRYKTPVSILIVAHDTSKLLLAGRNLPGLDIVTPQQLSILHLAPGGVPGRLTIYTKTSLQILNEKFPVKTI